jgi:hypothetical protein
MHRNKRNRQNKTLNHRLVKISLDVIDQSRENIEVVSEYYSLPKYEGVSKRSIVTGRNKVNLFNMSCSCKDYRASVTNYPKRDLRRICRHLYAGLFKELEDKLDDLTKLLLHNQFWFGQTHVKKILIYDFMLYIGLHGAGSTISFFVQKDKWEKFVFDIVLNEWMNSLKPFEDEILLNKLTEFIKTLNLTVKSG